MRIQEYLPKGLFWDNALSVLNAWKRLGYFPNIWRPRSINEIILSQKVRFMGDILLARRLTDKYEIKEWLLERGCGDLAIPTLGVFRSLAELRKASFDGEVIAKATHGSGSVIIRNAKADNPFSESDFLAMGVWLDEDYYARSREPNYKGLQHRIIVEPVLKDEEGRLPRDYKFHCVNGIPFMIQVDIDRFSNHRRQLYDTEWRLLPYSMGYPQESKPIPRPELLSRALDTAASLSQGFGFLRVDFYFVCDSLKLGELTFFPGNGAEAYSPPDGDFYIGRLSRDVCCEVR